MVSGRPSFRVSRQLIMQELSDELEKIRLIKFCCEKSNGPCSFYQLRSVGNKAKGQLQYTCEQLLPILCEQELLDHLQLHHNCRCHHCHHRSCRWHSWYRPFRCACHDCCRPQHNQGLGVLKAYISGIELNVF